MQRDAHARALMAIQGKNFETWKRHRNVKHPYKEIISLNTLITYIK